MNEDKIYYISKTLIVNAIIALVAFYPPLQEWVSNHPEETLWGVAAIGGLLRLVTRGRIVFK